MSDPGILQEVTLRFQGCDREVIFQPIAQRIISEVLDSEAITPEYLSEQLPIVRMSDWVSPPFHLSIFLLCKYRSDVAKFFQEMISKWLLPGRQISIDSFFSTRFRFFELERMEYLVAEAIVPVDSANAGDVIFRNFPTVVREIKLGLRSRFHAKRILEIKGISNSEKTMLIQEKIAFLVNRFPRMFDYDIFSMMQRFLITMPEKYMQARSHRLMTRIICMIYSFLKRLSVEVERTPRKRHLLLRVIRTEAETPFGSKRVLGFFVGTNLLKDNEIFDKRHLKRAVQRDFPSVRILDESYFVQTGDDDKIVAFYVEMEKEGEIPFSDAEVDGLRRELVDHLKGCIESLVRPLFMPRNEEEVMKYVVTLGSQIELVNDVPQIVIMFDEQTDRDLFFTVIVARIILPDTSCLESLFSKENGMYETSIERVRQSGFVEKKYPKEIAVLRMRLSNTPFIRDDFAVDLFIARQRVVKILKERLGEVRDYNGGMLAKQMEVVSSFKEMMLKDKAVNEHVLENFFHSLFPSELRIVTHLKRLKTFYDLFDRIRRKKDEFSDVFQDKIIDGMSVYWCAKYQDQRKAKKLLDEVLKMQIPTPQLIRLFLPVQDCVYIGFIFFSDSESQQAIFLDVLEEHL